MDSKKYKNNVYIKREYYIRKLNRLSTVVDQNILNIMKDTFWSVSIEQSIRCVGFN